jgi:hypothetical protein
LNRVVRVVESTTITQVNVFGLFKRRHQVVEHLESVSDQSQWLQLAKRPISIVLSLLVSTILKPLWLKAQAVWEAWQS